MDKMPKGNIFMELNAVVQNFGSFFQLVKHN